MKKTWKLAGTIVLLGMLLLACDKAEQNSVDAGKKRGGKGTPTPTAEVTPGGNEDPTPTPGGKEEPTPTNTVAPTPTNTVAPTPTPTPTDTPAPKPTGSVIPDPDPIEYYDLVFHTPNEALLAFADYLDGITADMVAQGMEPSIRFGLIYLNSDETPELWWAENNSHVDTVCICMYNGFQVVRVGDFGEFGCAKYFERGGTVVSEMAGMGMQVTELYGINVTTPILLADYISQPSWDENGKESRAYSVRGYDCDEKTFYDHMATWGIERCKVIDYANGIPMTDGNGDVISTSYRPLYETFLKMQKADYYRYDIPDDILEMLTGKWRLESYEVEGARYNAKEEGVDSRWILEPNGEAELTELAPGSSVAMGRMTFVPDNTVYGGGDAVWRVLVKDIDKSRPGYDHYLTITEDGKLFDYYVSYEDLFAVCRWYVAE